MSGAVGLIRRWQAVTDVARGARVFAMHIELPTGALTCSMNLKHLYRGLPTC